MYVCVFLYLCVLWLCVCSAHLQLCVINDSRGEWTLAVSPFWLFWADPVWAGHSGHKASGDLKILGHSLTCTSASALREYFHLLRERSAVSTQGHTFNHRERTLTVCSCSLLLWLEIALWKASMARWKAKDTVIIRLVINILPCHRYAGVSTNDRNKKKSYCILSECLGCSST